MLETTTERKEAFAPFVFRDYGIAYDEIFARFGAMITALDNGEKPDLTGDEVTELSQLMFTLLCEKYGGADYDA